MKTICNRLAVGWLQGHYKISRECRLSSSVWLVQCCEEKTRSAGFFLAGLGLADSGETLVMIAIDHDRHYAYGLPDVGGCVSGYVWRDLCTERSAHHITAAQNLQDCHALA